MTLNALSLNESKEPWNNWLTVLEKQILRNSKELEKILTREILSLVIGQV